MLLTNLDNLHTPVNSNRTILIGIQSHCLRTHKHAVTLCLERELQQHFCILIFIFN